MAKSILAVAVLLLLVAGGVYLLWWGSGMPEPATSAPQQERASVAEAGEFVTPAISPEEAMQRQQENPGRTVMVDVRTREEYDKLSIPGTLLIPESDADFAQQIAKAIPDKTMEVYLFCRSGRRSGLAGQTLHRLGYTKVYNMGGIIDWPYRTEGQKN